MKTIQSKDLKIGDKVFDIAPGNIERMKFEVVGQGTTEIQLKPIGDNLQGYLFDDGKDYISFPRWVFSDWYLV